jgi:hypothetical protein
MGLTATYDPVLSRIRLAGTVLGATGTKVMVTRSTNGGLSFDVVRGGFDAPYSGGSFNVDDYEFPAGVPIQYKMVTLDHTYTATITQDLDSIWMKVPAAPFLNRKITVRSVTEIKRAARQQVFPIVNRDNPVITSDRRTAPEFGMEIRTFGPAEEFDMEYLLATAEIIFIHLPYDETCMRGGYYGVGDVTWKAPNSTSGDRIWSLPLTTGAAPPPDVVGSTYTCLALVADYATCSAVVAGNATCAAVLEHTAAPVTTVVP